MYFIKQFECIGNFALHLISKATRAFSVPLGQLCGIETTPTEANQVIKQKDYYKLRNIPESDHCGVVGLVSHSTM